MVKLFETNALYFKYSNLLMLKRMTQKATKYYDLAITVK